MQTEPGFQHLGNLWCAAGPLQTTEHAQWRNLVNQGDVKWGVVCVCVAVLE